MTADERRAEALARATQGESVSNWPAIFEGFTARGIPEDQIIPLENVLTFDAWKAKGRYVRKGEKGVRVSTWVPMRKKDAATGEEVSFKRAKVTHVFHVSQTEPMQ